jgi:hypothetical protein
VLATHETRNANAAHLAERERKQQQWSTLAVVGYDNKRPKAFARSHKLLPGAKEIEPLKGRREMLLIFEVAPGRFSVAKVAEKIDTGDAVRFRPRWRIGRPAFDHGGYGHCEPVYRELFTYFSLRDFCKEMSTKSNDNPATGRRESTSTAHLPARRNPLWLRENTPDETMDVPYLQGRQ